MVSFQLINLDDYIYPYFAFSLKNHIWIILLVIIFTFIILVARKTYKDNCDATNNRYIIHNDEIMPNISYLIHYPENVKHILWTGGFDSTFLLCYYFIVLKHPVQPIYLMCGNIDSKFGIIGRNNQKQELESMKKIRNILISRYPHRQAYILPTYYVTSVKKDNTISKQFNNLHKKHGYFTRGVSQYERITRFSLDWNKPLLLGLEKCGTGLDHATSGYRIGIWDNCKILPKAQLPDDKKELHIFSKLRFPICHLTKNDMKNISLNNSDFFYDLLILSWSCWYPLSNGSACGICDMCKKRII
jgi:hypothetical protein